MSAEAKPKTRVFRESLAGVGRGGTVGAGVKFTPENGGGAGLRLRKGKAATDHPKPVGSTTDLIGDMDEAIDNDRNRKP